MELRTCSYQGGGAAAPLSVVRAHPTSHIVRCSGGGESSAAGLNFAFSELRRTEWAGR